MPEVMDASDVVRNTVIATIIGKGDSVRTRLHRSFARESAEYGYGGVAVFSKDADPDTLQHFNARGFSTYTQQGTTFGSAFREATKYALELGKVVAYTEAEKVGYVSQIGKTAAPVLNGQADEVVPRRRGLESYPPVQQRTETEGNLFFEMLTGHPLDVYFGPDTFNRAAGRHFLDYEKVEGSWKMDIWDAHMVPILDMLQAGLHVQSVGVAYEHPKEQRDAEIGDLDFTVKRFDQLARNSRAIREQFKELWPGARRLP